MEATMQAARLLLGLGAEHLTVWQMANRAVVVYVIAIAFVRSGKKRFMGRATAFDLILVIVLGSIISRVITGSTPFFPGPAAAATLVAMHWLFSAVGVRWQAFNVLVKGHSRLLVRDGEVDWEKMRKTHLTEDDLWEDLRAKGISDLDEIAEAHLERSGQVSVLRKKKEEASVRRWLPRGTPGSLRGAQSSGAAPPPPAVSENASVRAVASITSLMSRCSVQVATS